MAEVYDTVKSKMGIFINLTFRSLLLGGLIFLATTYIPQTELSTEIRATIAVVVVLIYSLLDLIAHFFLSAKDLTCELICGCSSGGSNEVDLTL